MKETWSVPHMEAVQLNNEDIIRTSGNTTPEIPLSL